MRRRTARLTCLATLVAVAGCVDPLPPMRPAALPSAPASSLAVVEIPPGSAIVESISVGNRQLYLRARDNPRYQPTEVELSPGRYTISYQTSCNAMPTRSDTITSALEAGHRYRAGGDCCYWWTEKFGCSYLWGSYTGTYQTFLWFEDVTTGTVIAGSRKVPATGTVEPSLPDVH